jgi:hypothetical protein
MPFRLVTGREITLHYPTTTHVRHTFDAAVKRRRIMIESIRDLVQDPLTMAEFLERPYVRRSRLLASAIDCDTGERRKFYLGNCAESFVPSQLKVGLYDPGATRPSEILFRPIEPTVHDRQLLIRALRIWSETRGCDVSGLRIFADDLRLVR